MLHLADLNCDYEHDKVEQQEEGQGSDVVVRVFDVAVVDGCGSHAQPSHGNIARDSSNLGYFRDLELLRLHLQNIKEHLHDQGKEQAASPKEHSEEHALPPPESAAPRKKKIIF